MCHGILFVSEDAQCSGFPSTPRDSHTRQKVLLVLRRAESSEFFRGAYISKEESKKDNIIIILQRVPFQPLMGDKLHQVADSLHG